MTRLNLFAKISFLVIAIIFSVIPKCSSVLSDKRLCYDPKCSEAVSLARTTIMYRAGEKGMLSVPLSQKVTVYSKGAGTRPDLWGIEFQGMRGYIPANFLKEYKVLRKNLTYEVPTEIVNSNNGDKDNKNGNINNNVNNLKNTELKNEESKSDSLPKHSSPSNVNIDTSVPNSDEGDAEHFINETENISQLQNAIDGTNVLLNNEATTQPSYASVKKVSTFIYNKQINTYDIHNESNKVKTDSQSIKEDNLNSSIVKLEQKKEESNEHSSTFELKHEGKEDDINSPFSESEDKKKDYINSSINVNQDEKEESNNVHSVTTELENTETNMLNANIAVLEPESQKQAEKEAEENNILNKTYDIDEDTIQSNNSMIAEEHSTESQQIDGSTKLINLNVIIQSNKEKVQESKVEDNILKGNVQNEVCDYNPFRRDQICKIDTNVIVKKQTEDTLEKNNQMKVQDGQINIVNSDIQNGNVMQDVSSSVHVPIETEVVFTESNEKLHSENDEQLHSSQNNAEVFSKHIFHEFRNNRNLSYVEDEIIASEVESEIQDTLNSTDDLKTETLPEYESIINIKDKVLPEIENKDVVTEEMELEKDKAEDKDDLAQLEETTLQSTINNIQDSDVCKVEYGCENDDINYGFVPQEKGSVTENGIMKMIKVEHTYWVTLLYLSITAITTLVFSLGYYYIENMRRDSQLIAKINKLEKELLLSTKECLALDDNLKSTKDKLISMQDESFGSNEMVLSLKADLKASQEKKAELDDQIAMLEKDLEIATEAGLELECMLREVLSSNNEVNPLAQSVEDLQARLNIQQSANESLTSSLNIKTQENEALSAELTAMKKNYEVLNTEFTRVTNNFQTELNKKIKIEEDLNATLQQLEIKVKQLTTDKTNLYKELQIKETELKDLAEVINQINSNNLDIEKLYEISHIKAEASQVLEERDELKTRLSEVEGAHNLLEEHMKVVKEEVSVLSEQCKLAEKEKRDAETRLEVISNYFKEKEAQRQKEEALWLQKQGEVMSTVERIHTMQNEIQGYKQQIEMLKREIVDQEREYKSQISALEQRAHEQWVMARQNERRLEESKAEAGQLRNRLTLIEKNLNDADVDTKLHRLEANGETTTSPPLFVDAESSSSPIIFTGSSGVPPPPPPSFMHPSLFPTYPPPPLPSTSGLPPYDVGQRPPTLGGRLSSPPPIPLHPPPSRRYDNADLTPPRIVPPFNPFPFGNNHMHPPPPPPPGSILPPPLGTSHSWGEETLPLPRNSGFHPHQREQRARNHKGSLHSSGESLDKSHHSGKV